MLKTLRRFPVTFHVANFMEIFERMAWYGFWIPAGLYMTAPLDEGGLGLSDVQRGVIVGVIPFLLYLFPVVTGAFADKFGFRRTFLLAYSVMAPGYYLLGKAGTFWSFFSIFLVVAVGAALFKPVVTGTVARVTTPETKALGFGIFYMTVNIGGFLGPVVAAVVRSWGWNWIFVMSAVWIGVNFLPLLLLYREPSHGGTASTTATTATAGTMGERLFRMLVDITHVLGNARFFLYVAVVILLLMLAGGNWISWAWFLWGTLGWTALNLLADAALRGPRLGRDDAEPRTLAAWVRSRHGMGGPMRLGDWRFGLYLLILSGFWTEFNQLFLTMPLYIRDYTDTSGLIEAVRSALGAVPGFGDGLAGWWAGVQPFVAEGGQIKPDFLINLDALLIIFFQVAVTAVFARRKPFTTMVAGTLLTGVSMLLGVGGSVGWVILFAIAVFSLGEMMASPKSQEYVARIAPPDKAAMYMGYYFVSMALGNLFGGLLSGQAYQHFANPETGIGRPDLMWMVFAAVALATALALALFDRFCARREPLA